jgi:hypothetical protein
MSEHAGRVKNRPDPPCLKTPPRCRRRLASPRLARVVPTAPPPVPEADHIAVRASCPCRARHRRCPAASAIAKSSTVSGAPSTPLPLFLCGLLSQASSPPSTSTQDRRRSPEPSPRRRTLSPIRFPPPPSRRQEAPVSYRLHPHARRVASSPWVLERLPLLHLPHGSDATGRAVTRAPRAVTLCTRAEPRCGRGSCATVQLGRVRIQPSGSRISFLFSKYIQILANLKICVGFI